MPKREDEREREPRQKAAANGMEGPQEWEDRKDQPWAGEDRERIAPERVDEYSGRGDWGNQGAWGRFGNRADWRHDRDWENAGGDWAAAAGAATEERVEAEGEGGTKEGKD